MKRWSGLLILLVGVVHAESLVPASAPAQPDTQKMEYEIKGQFRGRLALTPIPDPIPLDMESMQDFPEDYAQKILDEPLAIPNPPNTNVPKN